MQYVDLHLHTNHSDGSDDPARVVERAAAIPLAAIAITDHDTVSGVGEGALAAGKLGIGFLPALEISAVFAKREAHILGIGVDPQNGPLLEALTTLKVARDARADLIMERLREAGVPIDPDRVRARASGAVGRMHIARELREMGRTKSTQAGFDRYLNFGRSAYVPKTLIEAQEAIDVIHAAGGLAFIAHPGLNKSIKRLLPYLMELPFDGIEAYHISHSPGYTTELLHLADEHHLLITGGSDCHGSLKESPEMGKVMTPYAHYERICERLGR